MKRFRRTSELDKKLNIARTERINLRKELKAQGKSYKKIKVQ